MPPTDRGWEDIRGIDDGDLGRQSTCYSGGADLGLGPNQDQLGCSGVSPLEREFYAEDHFPRRMVTTHRIKHDLAHRANPIRLCIGKESRPAADRRGGKTPVKDHPFARLRGNGHAPIAQASAKPSLSATRSKRGQFGLLATTTCFVR